MKTKTTRSKKATTSAGVALKAIARRRQVDARLAKGLEDIQNGREYGPFDSAEKMVEFSEARVKPREDAARRGQRLQLEARSHHDTVARLEKVENPTYICAGKHDGIAPPENQHALAKALPNATLEFFEGGHLFLIQDPSAFRKIEAFLAEEG